MWLIKIWKRLILLTYEEKMVNFRILVVMNVIGKWLKAKQTKQKKIDGLHISLVSTDAKI